MSEEAVFKGLKNVIQGVADEIAQRTSGLIKKDLLKHAQMEGTLRLFLRYHFTQKVVQPIYLRPVRMPGGRLHFPTPKVSLIPNQMSFLDKVRYYVADLSIWLKRRCYR